MEFSWSDVDEDRFESAVRFADASINPRTRDAAWDTVEAIDFILLAELGIPGLTVGRDLGGSGLGALSAARVIEALGYGADDRGLVFAVLAHLFACAMPIANYASDEAIAQFFPGLAAGHLVGSNAITEEGSGSDVFSLETTATAVDGGYVLNGSKSYVTNAPIADVFLVYGSTDRSHGHLGITAMLVERGQEGVEVGVPFEKVGLRSAPVASVAFVDCFVPGRNVLGLPGQGAAIFTESMRWERSCLMAMYLGVMQRCLDRATDRAVSREQFGQRLSTFQAVSHSIVDMHMQLESARLLLYRACWDLDRGGRSSAYPAEAKLAVGEAAVDVCLRTLHLFGGAGIRAGEIEAMLRDALPARVLSGTSEIQKGLIAKSLRL